MTTPSKLSLKKKTKQKLVIPSANDHEEEKENNSRGSINLSGKSSRRCSTIIAGNLFLNNESSHFSGKNRINEVEDKFDEADEAENSLITDDESSFYSCSGYPDKSKDNNDAVGVMESWMTELTIKETISVPKKNNFSTPQNKPNSGNYLFISNLKLSVSRVSTECTHKIS